MKLNEPLIKQKNYSKEQYLTKKRKSFGVAKRVIIMSELSYIFGVNGFFALGLFLVQILVTDFIPYAFNIDIDFSAGSFMFRGGLSVYLSVFFVILFTITSFWYAFGYKKLEIMCIHLDGLLEGALEVNQAAFNDNINNNLKRKKKASYKSIAGALTLAVQYLISNNIKMISVKTFKRIHTIFIVSQILIVCVSTLLLIK